MLQTVFLQVLKMHKTAAAVIAVVLLIRLLLKKAPKKWSYALWSVVGFRLVCPVSFQAVFSLFSLGSTAASTPQPGGPYTAPGPTAAYPVQQILPATYDRGIDAYIPAPVPAADPTEIGLRIASVVWIIGIAALLIYSIISYVNIRKQLANAVRLEGSIWQSDRVRSPFILGFVKPRIYIPFGLDDEALQVALAHERCHLRHRDHWVKPLAFLLLAIHWFDPLVWLAFQLMTRDMEMRTDEEVLASGAGTSKAYSITLLSFAANRRFPVPSPLAFGESSVKSRIKHALRWKRPRLWTTVLAVLLCGAVIAACAADPKEAAETPACAVTVNEAAVDAQYYPDGFDYDYDNLMSVMPYESEIYTLTFKPSWETECLTVSEGYYGYDGSVAHTTHALKRTSDGLFTLEVSAPRQDTEYALYFISAETGVLAVRVYFQTYRYWNIQLSAENLTQTGATILLRNYTARDGVPQTGERFWLERMDGTNWGPVGAKADAEAIWNTIAYEIGSEALALECDWSQLYGSLPDGIYRLGKEVSDGGETMNCYFYFSFPAYLGDDPSCSVEIGDTDVPVRWFPEGFNFEYEKLTPLELPCQETYELIITPSWECETLKIGQDFYTRNGSASNIYCESYDLPKENGAFRFTVSRMNPEEEEKAVFYIPYEDGKFVFQLILSPRESVSAADADPLEAAVHQAIMSRGKDPHSQQYFSCESHVTLAHVTSDGLATDNSGWRGQDTLYLMVLTQEYEITENGIRDQGGSHMPVKLTFDRYADGTFALVEYWTPEDCTLYADSIRETFPEFLWEDALDTQKYILPQIQNCYAQAVVCTGLDTEPILDALFDKIASSPAQSSNPGDYLDAHPLEVRELTYYGDYTLDYIFRRFLAGGQTGLRGHLMYHVMEQLIGREIVYGPGSTGQDLFDLWRSHIQTEREYYGEKWLQKNRPKGWLLMQLLDEQS